MINLILWLLFGAFLGWLLGRATRRDPQQSLQLNIAMGIAGAMIGGFLLGGPVISSNFSLSALLMSMIGAVFLSLIANLFRPRLMSNAPLNHNETSKSRLNQTNQKSTTGNNVQSKVSFIGETNVQEHSVIIGQEEVPLDNRFGSNVLVSEHEFSRKASRTVKVQQNNDLSTRLQIGLWSVIEAEARGNLAQSLGIDLQSEEFRRVTLKFEAAPGKLVLYRVIWKQSYRTGEIEMQVGNQSIRLPYTATYGLSHSVASVSQQV